MSHSYSAETESDFNRARLKAFWNELRAMITRRPNEMLSFEEVKRSLKTFGENYRGVRTVPIEKIVGSATLRYHDFDRAFLPTGSTTKSRWRRVDEAFYEDVDLPPVELYQVGQVYFVRDGHHRISVARERGQEYIEAEVIEMKTRVPLTPELTARDLDLVGEYAQFIEKTQIDKLRPAQNIVFSEPGGYARLLEHIAVHRYFLGEEHQTKIAWKDAVISWYDNLYLPVERVIREHAILKDFPNRTEADLYLWVMDHHYFLREQGAEVDWEQAAIDLQENFSERMDKKFLRGVRQAVLDFLDANNFEPLEGTMTSEPHHEETATKNDPAS